MATTDGVVRTPSAFSMTFGFLPSMTATQELVVPRSIPMILAMSLQLSPLRRMGVAALMSVKHRAVHPVKMNLQGFSSPPFYRSA